MVSNWRWSEEDMAEEPAVVAGPASILAMVDGSDSIQYRLKLKLKLKLRGLIDFCRSLARGFRHSIFLLKPLPFPYSQSIGFHFSHYNHANLMRFASVLAHFHFNISANLRCHSNT